MGDFHSVWETPDQALVDVTPPKFGQSGVLFVRDRVTDIYVEGGMFVLPTNRMSPPNAQFWWGGAPTLEPIWGFPPQTQSFSDYCAALGFSPAQFETDSTVG